MEISNPLGSTKRHLAFPQAVKAASVQAITYYSQTGLQNSPYNIQAAKVFIPYDNANFVIYTGLNTGTQNLNVYADDVHITNVIGGKNTMYSVMNWDTYKHKCKTHPGNEVWVPCGRFFDSSNSQDYIILFASGEPVPPATRCSGQYGKILIYELLVTSSLVSLQDAMENNKQGTQAFHDPNTLGLGLPAFDGYTKVVSSLGPKFDNTYHPTALVFYEDT